MPHPPILQRPLTHSEFKGAIKGLSDAEACEQVISSGETMVNLQPHIHRQQFAGDGDGKTGRRPERIQRGKWEVA